MIDKKAKETDIWYRWKAWDSDIGIAYQKCGFSAQILEGFSLSSSPLYTSSRLPSFIYPVLTLTSTYKEHVHTSFFLEACENMFGALYVHV